MNDGFGAGEGGVMVVVVDGGCAYDRTSCLLEASPARWPVVGKLVVTLEHHNACLVTNRR